MFDVDVSIADVRRYGLFAVETDASAALDPVEQRLAAMLAGKDYGDAVPALVAAIKERGLERATIGVDDLGILPAYWDRLVEALPQAKLIRATDVFRHARAVKTPTEVERLRRAAHIAERSIEAALAVAKEGATEIDMGVAFHGCTVREQGSAGAGLPGGGSAHGLRQRPTVAASHPARRRHSLRCGRPLTTIIVPTSPATP